MPVAPIVSPNAPGIQQAAESVRNGGLIVYPTETVYGLGVDPFNPKALDRVYKLKGRESEKALIILIHSAEDLESLVVEIPPVAQRLIESFWPGPLTLIFKARPELPRELLGDRDTIAIRVSNAITTSVLLEALDGPLTSTSANRSANPPVLSAEEAAREFQSEVDLILDGGIATSSQPSTLLNVITNPVSLLREGRISASEIRDVAEM